MPPFLGDLDTAQAVDHEETIYMTSGESSDSSDNEKEESDSDEENDKLADEVANEEAEQEALELFGDPLGQSREKPHGVNPHILSRWDYWRSNGLAAAEKEKLLAQFGRNGPISLDAPKMNLEAAAVINDGAKERDKHFSDNQNQLGTALAAMGGVMTSLYEKTEEFDRKKFLGSLMDVGKLLADLSYRLSISRRAFITPGIPDKSIKAVLEASVPGVWLFGNELGEQLKATKAIKKAGLEFLAPSSSKPKKSSGFPSKSGNKKSLPRYRGHQQQAYNKKKTPNKAPYGKDAAKSFQKASQGQESQKPNPNKN